MTLPIMQPFKLLPMQPFKLLPSGERQRNFERSHATDAVECQRSKDASGFDIDNSVSDTTNEL